MADEGTTIDSLQIKVEATASDAVKAIGVLTKKLQALKEACNGGCGLYSIVNELKATRGALNALDNNGSAKLISLAEGLKSLKGVGKFNLPESLATTLQTLSSSLSSVDGDVATKLQGFAGGLQSLATVGKVSISSTLGKHLMEVAQAGEYFSAHASGMIAMTDALSALGQVSKVSVSSTAGSHLIDMAIGLEELSKVNIEGIRALSDAMQGINGLKITASTVKNLEALGKAAETLVGRDYSGLVKLNEELTKMSHSLPKISQNLPALNSALGQIDQTSEETAESTKSLASSYTDLYAAFQLARHAITAITRTVAGWIDKSNSYIENVNLFTASMGEYADEAKAYAEQVGEIMGIDPGSWMRNQGVFQTLSTGFGVAADRAAIMSKNLTQLGYDLSSFFNIAVEGEGGAMQKLQAGLAGELEPLRRLGFDLSEARLKAVALSLGIDKTYKSMNQAEKAQLRYYAILNQVTMAQGDMARTLNSPANQLRILKAQVEQAARALGNIFIPLLNAVLPYLIAAAKAVRILANAVASLFGFQMPEVDYSGISMAASASEDLSAGLGSSAKNAKKLNELLADWDELNIIASESDSGGGGAGAGIGANGGGFDFDLPEYDFLAGLIESNVNSIMDTLKPVLDWMTDHIGAVLDLITLVGIGFLTWKIDKTLTGDIGKVIKFILGAALAVWGAKMAYEDFLDQWNNGVDVNNMIALIKDLAIVAFGLGLMFGKVGFAIGFVIAGVVLAIKPLQSLIDKGKLTEEEFWQLEAAIGAIGIGIGLMTGSWIPLIIAGIVDLGLYIWQHWEEVQKWWYDNVQPLLDTIWDFIDTYVIQPIVSGVVDLYNTVSAWVESAYNTVSQWVSNLCDVVVKWVTDAYHSVSGWVEKAYNTVVAWVIDLYNSIKTWVEDTYNTVSSWVENAYNSVVGWVVNLYNEVVLWVETAYHSVVSWVETAVNSVTEWFSTAYNNVVGWVKSTYEGVVNWVTTAKSDIENIIASIGEWWNSTAVPFIMGIVNWIDTNIVQPVLWAAESIYLGILKDIENVGAWWNSTVKPWINGAIAYLDEHFIQPAKDLFEALKAVATFAFERLKSNIMEKIQAIGNWWNTTVIAFIDRAVNWVNSKIKLIEEFFNGIPAIIEIAIGMVSDWWLESVIPWFNNKLEWINAKIQAVCAFFEGIPTAIEIAIAMIATWWTNSVVPWFNEKISWVNGKIEEIKAFFSSIPDAIKAGFALLGTWWDTTVTPWLNTVGEVIDVALAPVREFGEGLYNSLVQWFGKIREEGLFTTIINDIKEGFNGLVKWVKDNVVNPMLLLWGDLVNGLITAANWVIDKLNSFNITLGPWNLWDAQTVDLGILGQYGIPAVGIPQVKIGISGIPNIGAYTPPQFAEGGFPNTGEMFMARENGATELVGSIGNRAAVANNDQIISGIAEGVSDANSAQNALLEIANQYLRIIAAKTGQNPIGPSVDLARVVKRSEEMRLVAEGV